MICGAIWSSRSNLLDVKVAVLVTLWELTVAPVPEVVTVSILPVGSIPPASQWTTIEKVIF
jgi:hypothetical protein